MIHATAPLGSHPRAWGQLFWHCGDEGLVRFTPTRVGTTERSCESVAIASVHPHARGDNPLTTMSVLCRIGSPPRAWGQPFDPRFSRVATRFTPTRVGTTGRCG